MILVGLIGRRVRRWGCIIFDGGGLVEWMEEEV